jgi:hypothetical protein
MLPYPSIETLDIVNLESVNVVIAMLMTVTIRAIKILNTFINMRVLTAADGSR